MKTKFSFIIVSFSLASADLVHTAGNEGCCQVIVGQGRHW